MPKKTNKTSHVLNLITNGAAMEEGNEERAGKTEGFQEAPSVQAPAAGPPSVQAPAADSQAVQTPAAVPPAVQAPATAPQSAPEATPLVQTIQQVPVTEKRVTVVNKDSENDKLSSRIMDQLAGEVEKEEEQEEETYRMINVMEQILKRQNLKGHMEQYGVCLCSRCCADVEALILTRLPAKYVVVDYSTVAPIIGYYESKFRVRILTEIVKSCLDVKENPRHSRTGQIQYIKKSDVSI